MRAARDGLIAALDVGSSKVACFIARSDEANDLKVLGLGHRMCRGVRGGAVIDVEETERAIRAAVEQAERVAGETIEEVIVSISGGRPKSHVIEVEVAIGNHRVEEADIARVIAQARADINAEGRSVIHAFPACFAIDGAYGVMAPIGMYGATLAVTMHVVTVEPGPLRNIESCVERAHLGVSRFVLAPYASGLSALVEDEKALGAAVIDLGAGSTQLAIFIAGAMVHSDCVPVGANHITNDIARGLLTPMEHAERLKTLYGAAVTSTSDDREVIDVPQLGEGGPDEDSGARLPRSMLTGIIEPRAREIFEMCRARLDDSGFDGAAARRVVLTGGGAQLPGISELARQTLGKQVRIGRPHSLPGLADATTGPAFATCAGMLLFDRLAPRESEPKPVLTANLMTGSRFARVGRWLKENL